MGSDPTITLWRFENPLGFQTESSFGNVEVHSFTLSYTLESMRCDSQASLLAHTFASPCFGCELKAKVVT